MTAATEIPESVFYAMHAHATRLRRRFPMVERDDVMQEMAVWFYSHPQTAGRYLKHEDFGKLSWALRNAGLAYCHREKASRLGYDVDDLYFYSLSTLRILLPMLDDDEDRLRISRWAGEQSRGADAVVADRHLEIVAALADVSKAYGRLTGESRLTLDRAIAADLDYEALAVEWVCTAAAAQARVTRALKRLQEELGGGRPDWAAAGRTDDDAEHLHSVHGPHASDRLPLDG